MEPILYSFRRCPYAIRARLAIKASGINVQLREVILKAKPAEMLTISPKGTVPVLQLSDGRVIDESIDIMYWALAQHDIDAWLDAECLQDIKTLVKQNDNEFKYYLDRYKYADRYPQHSPLYYRQQAEAVLQHLECRLGLQRYLLRDNICFADIAIFPFVRQFAHVDKTWFYGSKYKNLQRWLDALLESDLFLSVMKKQQVWKTGDRITWF